MILHQLVNEGLVQLAQPEQEDLLSVVPRKTNKSYWKSVLRVPAWGVLNDMIWPWLNWAMPDNKGSFFDYVTVHETTNNSTGMQRAAFVQIKPEVIAQ